MTDITISYFRHFELTKDAQAAAVLTLAEAVANNSNGANKLSGMLNVKQSADYLSVSAMTIRNLIECGKLPASKIGKGRGTLRINQADLDRYKKESAGHNGPAQGYTTRLLPPRN